MTTVHKNNFDGLKYEFLYAFDLSLVIVTIFSLIVSFLLRQYWSLTLLAAISIIGLIPVLYSAMKALIKKELSVDLLATIALVFSFLTHEWFSAAFITLMLSFARLFDRITEAKAKKIISSLMKYHVEQVKLKIGESVKEVHISQVKKGDLIIVESGDRMPVDGVVISGGADVDESSLTGESELVPKKVGDRVSTATINESGSLIVRAEKIGEDSTLSRILFLIEEASRSKNKAERVADRFTQWYIVMTLAASLIMYFLNIPTKVILSVLLVVCADDIAVAVPLAFTIAITRAAKRGVIIKGSSALEQLSRLKYILTDKTGTLTKGKPKVVNIKAYGNLNEDQLLERLGMGSSESKHAVSRAILEYIVSKGMKIRTPNESEELPGQGIIFSHDSEKMLLGRLVFMEKRGIRISETIKKDVESEKDLGNGIAMLAVNGEIAGFVSFHDELRPRVKEIIAETKSFGVEEWHMLTGDNENAAKSVATFLGIRHYHANMTPETKVEFLRKFEKEHSSKGVNEGVVGYIGDGVNDAASLALADVSIAMGGIGSDAAIEAADITIMKDYLSRVPEIMALSKKVMNVMKWNFAIWAITNGLGLGLVAFGFIGPAGAATYNFLTDFIPIVNAMRAGKGIRKK